MPVIKAQRIPKKERKIGQLEEQLMQFCYLYPQYKLHEAQKLPNVRIRKMIDIARKEQAKMLHYMTRIVAAPHTKKGKGVADILNELKNIFDS